MASDLRPTRIALLGFGTVGASVARALSRFRLPGLTLTHIYNRGIARKQASPEAAHVPAGVVWTEDVEVTLDSGADVVVELVGGLEALPDLEESLGIVAPA